jgi:hypothetical protein
MRAAACFIDVSDLIVNNEGIIVAMKELIWKRKYKCMLNISPYKIRKHY